MTSFVHPQLGRIRPIVESGTRRFYGLKYALLEHAFAEPKLWRGGNDEGEIDATQHGPTAVSPPGGCDMELHLIQKSLKHEQFASSTTECLNLNLVVPEQNSGPLPVFVFLHGGGFSIGANAWPQYDLARLVKLSSDLGKPVIGVQINYRLGVYGFLYSSALRDAGIKANRGIRDQRTALEWVGENIAGFGGDPEQVTLVGESAGGVSATLHLQSTKPLFQQLVSLGGTSLLMKPLPLFVADISYSTVLRNLQYNGDGSAEDQLASLLAVAPETVLSSIGPDVPLLPVVDGDIIKANATFAQWESSDISSVVPGVDWCRRALLGDCQNDGMILTFALIPRRDTIVSALQKALETSVSSLQSDVNAVLEAYGITASDSPDQSMAKILRLIHDIQFYAPAITLSKAWPKSSFICHFNEPNPWNGPAKGEANHILDVAFLFQNFNEYLDPTQAKSAGDFGRDFILFVNGEDPFPRHDLEKGGAKVYGDGGFVTGQDAAVYGRRPVTWELASRFGLDKLSRALDMLIAGH
ncbi:para-nitrobenzyl esterase [Pyrenochaeta sp. DS3sAY3a]|nr:para-nitrobenzyl esterase [Pyrenochaeta sp. DS3sAY3a]